MSPARWAARDDLRVHYVHAEAVRWVDQEWPGWVEIRLFEADGTAVSIVEKVPVVDHDDRVAPGVEFPVALEIPCEIVDRAALRHGGGSLAIRLLCGVEDQAGRTVFNVYERAVITRS